MPADPAAEPKTAETLRLELRSYLLRRERTLRGKSNPAMGALAGISGPTFSHAANAASGWNVHEDTWVKIGEGLGWGAFLDYVASGNIAAIARCEGVPEKTRDIATEQLTAIAENGI